MWFVEVVLVLSSPTSPQLSEIPLLSVRLDLLFTIKEFPTNIESFQPVGGNEIPVFFFLVFFWFFGFFLLADLCTSYLYRHLIWLGKPAQS